MTEDLSAAALLERIKTLEAASPKPDLDDLPLGKLMRYTAANLELDANALVGSVKNSGANLADHTVTDVKMTAKTLTTASIADAALPKLSGVAGITSGPTNGGGPAGLSDMSISTDSLGRPCLAVFTGQFTHNAGGTITLDYSDNGTIRATSGVTINAGEQKNISLVCPFTSFSGTRSHSILWTVTGGTGTATTTRRYFALLEIPT